MSTMSMSEPGTAELSRSSSNPTPAPPSADVASRVVDLPHRVCKAPPGSVDWLACAEIARGDNVLGVCGDQFSGFDADAFGMMAFIGRGLLVD
jgi:hypothetical protein